jgi:hypothetical protein
MHPGQGQGEAHQGLADLDHRPIGEGLEEALHGIRREKAGQSQQVGLEGGAAIPDQMFKSLDAQGEVLEPGEQEIQVGI